MVYYYDEKSFSVILNFVVPHVVKFLTFSIVAEPASVIIQTPVSFSNFVCQSGYQLGSACFAIKSSARDKMFQGNEIQNF